MSLPSSEHLHEGRRERTSASSLVEGLPLTLLLPWLRTVAERELARSRREFPLAPEVTDIVNELAQIVLARTQAFQSRPWRERRSGSRLEWLLATRLALEARRFIVASSRGPESASCAPRDRGRPQDAFEGARTFDARPSSEVSEERATLAQLLDALPWRCASVLRARWALDGNPLTNVHDLARRFRRCPNRIWQLEFQGLALLLAAARKQAKRIGSDLTLEPQWWRKDYEIATALMRWKRLNVGRPRAGAA